MSKIKQNDAIDILIKNIRILRYKLLGRHSKLSLLHLHSKNLLLPHIKPSKAEESQKFHKRTSSLFIDSQNSPGFMTNFKRTTKKPRSIKEKENPILNGEVQKVNKSSLLKSSASLNLRDRLVLAEVSVEDKTKIKEMVQEKIQQFKNDFRIPQKTFNAEIKMLKENINSSRFYKNEIKELKYKYFFTSNNDTINIERKCLTSRDGKIDKNELLNNNKKKEVKATIKSKFYNIDNLKDKTLLFSKIK
jgi:hypothetical protein